MEHRTNSTTLRSVRSKRKSSGQRPLRFDLSASQTRSKDRCVKYLPDGTVVVPTSRSGSERVHCLTIPKPSRKALFLLLGKVEIQTALTFVSFESNLKNTI
jgi:hypothetical protein